MSNIWEDKGIEVWANMMFHQCCLFLDSLFFFFQKLQNVTKFVECYKPGFNSTWTVNFQIFKLDLEKAKEPEIKLPTSVRSSKKQESSRKTSTSALLTMLKPLTVWNTTNCVEHNKLCKILQEMGIPDHLTRLLRNLFAGQEATVRTGHGTPDWFQIGKGVLYIVTLLI